MIFFISFLLIIVAFFILASSIAILRSANSLEIIEITKTVNYYLLPLFIILIQLQNFTWQSFIKAILLSILIIIIGNISCGLVVKKQAKN